MARRRATAAPTGVLQKSGGAAAQVWRGQAYLQLDTDQRHAAQRRVVSLPAREQLARGHLHRRTTGISRRVPPHRVGRTDMAESDARHTPAEEARRGVERHGGGERFQCRLSTRLLPLLQGERLPVSTVHAHRGAHGEPRRRQTSRHAHRCCRRTAIGHERHARAVGTLSLHHLRRVGAPRRGQDIRGAVRLYACQLGRRDTRHLYVRQGVRTRRRDGVQRRCLLLRPLRVPRIPTGQHTRENHYRDALRRATAALQRAETQVAATGV